MACHHHCRQVNLGPFLVCNFELFADNFYETNGIGTSEFPLFAIRNFLDDSVLLKTFRNGLSVLSPKTKNVRFCMTLDMTQLAN